MQPIVRYTNGNYTVTLDTRDGTKIRENDLDFFEPAFPESADVKITNCCTDPLGKNCGNCSFCHEGSGPNGKHSDALHSPVWDTFHKYTEIALGGGNVLEYPDLIPLLERMKSLSLIPNITVHQTHFMQNIDLLHDLVKRQLIYGIGISLFDERQEGFIYEVKRFPSAVIHVINGIVTMDSLWNLASNDVKILILGYKEVRRGANLYEAHKESIDEYKGELYHYLPEIIKDEWFNVVSFDNLAIKQLQPQRLMSQSEWDEMYMGDDNADGKFTSASMYIDLVNNKFSANSCSPMEERWSVEMDGINSDINNMFKFLAEKYNEDSDDKEE